jgi:hypothetical protein
MKIVIDIDGVIFEEMPTFERSLAKIKLGAPEKIQQLVAEGHTVILHTARGWAEYEMTVAQLKEAEIPYHSLVMGKPIADILVDDRAVTSVEEIYDKLPKDDYNLKVVRKHIYHTLVVTIPYMKGPVVEIGPMFKPTMPFPEYYLNTRKLIKGRGHEYISFDHNAQCRPDVLGDIINIDGYFEPESIQTIIAMSVIEHVPRIDMLPKLFYKILKPKGQVILQTPFNLRFHGPAPDCWRITDTGYHYLFGDYFDIWLDMKGDKTHPASIVAILRKHG